MTVTSRFWSPETSKSSISSRDSQTFDQKDTFAEENVFAGLAQRERPQWLHLVLRLGKVQPPTTSCWRFKQLLKFRSVFQTNCIILSDQATQVCRILFAPITMLELNLGEFQNRKENFAFCFDLNDHTSIRCSGFSSSSWWSWGVDCDRRHWRCCQDLEIQVFFEFLFQVFCGKL